jgi:ATP-dependent RNA helicase RhlE
VATDIAARGIDVDNLSHVINYELPNVPETYVHRIGRTGRAGATGIAYSFCDSTEQSYLKDIEKLIGKSVPKGNINPFTVVFSGPIPPKPAQYNKPSGRRPQRNASPRQGSGQKSSNQSSSRKPRP